MLARLAENLFWAGRYLERAEDTARMVDVTYHSLLETAAPDDSRPWLQLLDVLHLRGQYLERHDAAELEPVVAFLVLDESNPGSISTSVARMRENVRSVRELVSTELWEAVNEFYLELRDRNLRQDVEGRPFELFRTIKRRCHTITGIIDETMLRDDGWRFVLLGRMLERAEMTCRLVNVRRTQLTAQAFGDWAAVLKSASGLEAYRRTYSTSTDPVDVVEFLVLSRTFPRSVAFSLEAAREQLDALHAGDGTMSRAHRLLGRTCADLEYHEVREVMDDLPDYLDGIQDAVVAAADAIGDEFFRHQAVGELHTIATT